MSPGLPWVMPLNLTVTFVIDPDMSETTMLDGYNEAGAGVPEDGRSLTTIFAGFEKVIPSQGVGVGVGVKVAVGVGVGVNVAVGVGVEVAVAVGVGGTVAVAVAIAVAVGIGLGDD